MAANSYIASSISGLMLSKSGRHMLFAIQRDESFVEDARTIAWVGAPQNQVAKVAVAPIWSERAGLVARHNWHEVAQFAPVWCQRIPPCLILVRRLSQQALD